MEVTELERLLDMDHYMEFLEDIARGKLPIDERDEWLSWFEGDVGELAKTLKTIGRRLWEANQTVLYPIDCLVVPRYPFSKQPMVKWSGLKDRGYQDYEVNKLKELAGRLGRLVNAAFILKNFVLIDVDGKPEGLRKYADVETRRGYHIIRYIPNFEAVKFKLPNNQGTKVSVSLGNLKLELISGKNYLGSFPLQSRYLEFASGKVNVRSYRLLSKEAEYAFRSADLTPLRASIGEVKAIVEELFRSLGYEGYAKHFDVEGIEREVVVSEVPSVNPKESRFNRETTMALGVMSYMHFKAALSTKMDRLPVCIKRALYGNPEKGTRYYHLRLLLAVVPYFVLLDQGNREALVKDFADRTESKRSETREWTYHASYFTGRLIVDDQAISTASRLGVPAEAWSTFESLGYCKVCPLRVMCLGSDPPARRKVIVNYLERLLEV